MIASDGFLFESRNGYNYASVFIAHDKTFVPIYCVITSVMGICGKVINILYFYKFAISVSYFGSDIMTERLKVKPFVAYAIFFL